MIAAASLPPVRLPVVTDGAQDCSTCQSMSHCWGSRSDRVMINLLVCRLHRQIDRERNLRRLLELLRPKTLQLAKVLARKICRPVREVLVDIETHLYFSIVHEYQVGEVLPPLAWLFGKNGSITNYVRNRLRALRQERRRFISYDGGLGEYELEERLAFLNRVVTDDRIQSGPPVLEFETEPVLPDVDADLIRSVIEDGVTLTTAEYRALHWVVAGEGSQRWLAAAMSIKRQDVTVLVGVARRKIRRRFGARATKTVIDTALERGVSVRYVYQLRKQGRA